MPPRQSISFTVRWERPIYVLFLKRWIKIWISKNNITKQLHGKSRRPSERAIKRQYLSRIRALTTLTQQNHCIFHNFCFAPYSCVFTDAKPCVSTKRFSPPFRSECWSKVQTQKYKLPFPSGTCFYFSAVAANQNSHLLSCSTQVNLSSGARSPAISAKEGRDEASQHAPTRAPPQDVHSAQRELSQTGAESILGDIRNEFFLSSNVRTDLWSWDGFCFDCTPTRRKKTTCGLSPIVQQKYATDAWLIRICLTTEK